VALSTIVRQTCKVCGKIAIEKSRINFATSRLITLECGHVTSEEVMSTGYVDIAHILNGCTLMPYQVEGVEFLQRANARAILGDEQGLGKTLEVLALIKLHMKELLPAVITVPSSVKFQWLHEIINKCGVQGFLTQVIDSGKVLAAPGFDIYITTYDLLKNEDAFKFVQGDIKLLVLDEAQRIKNHLSGRAKAVQKFVKAMGIEHIIPMSGTMIKNNAGEYFTSLNLVNSRMFPQYAKFIEQECDSYHNGYGYKIGGLKNPQLFREKTQDFIIRRRQKDVLADLPELSRKFYHVELDKRLNPVYGKLMEELEEEYYNEDTSGFEKSGNMLAIMNRLRQITGISKTVECVDFVTEFIESTDRKIVVFAHHHAAEDKLEIELNNWLAENDYKWKVVRFRAGNDFHVTGERFRESDSRIMIASTQAGGVGGNLQFVSDAVMLERQWNPGDEEQAEKRHHRYGQKNAVSVTYMIASGTIDEYFTELVERKRAIVSSSLDGKEIVWDETSLMSELAAMLISKGRKGWTL
jgi:SWI/SNF-related matrix-associated actin-dependent regulator 1 of chromatin subfamily A